MASAGPFACCFGLRGAWFKNPLPGCAQGSPKKRLTCFSPLVLGPSGAHRWVRSRGPGAGVRERRGRWEGLEERWPRPPPSLMLRERCNPNGKKAWMSRGSGGEVKFVRWGREEKTELLGSKWETSVEFSVLPKNLTKQNKPLCRCRCFVSLSFCLCSTCTVAGGGQKRIVS